MPAKSYRPPAAFTMLELLVAVTATVIMVLFLNQIFTSMTGAVSAGKATSVVIENVRAMIDQIADDAEAMTSPLDGGFLVIMHREVTAPYKESAAPQTFRADQIVWVRDAARQSPIAPGYGDSLDTASNATHAILTYGQGLITQESGAEPATVDLGTNPQNQYATRWAFIRQARFLDPALPVPRTTDTASPFYDRVYAVDPTYNAAVSYRVPPTDPDAAPLLTYRGLTDVAAGSLDDLTGLMGILTGNGYATVYDYTYATERLRVNPASHGTSTWRMAQMHPLLALHVSSIEISFAGDYEENLTGTKGAPDTEVDIRAGRILWYGHNLTPADQPVFLTDPVSPTYDANPVPQHADAAWIFRAGPAGVVQWPKLIRIRYRIGDANGRLIGGDGLPGKLFEQMFRVNHGLN